MILTVHYINPCLPYLTVSTFSVNVRFVYFFFLNQNYWLIRIIFFVNLWIYKSVLLWVSRYLLLLFLKIQVDSLISLSDLNPLRFPHRCHPCSTLITFFVCSSSRGFLSQRYFHTVITLTFSYFSLILVWFRYRFLNLIQRFWCSFFFKCFWVLLNLILIYKFYVDFRVQRFFRSSSQTSILVLLLMFEYFILVRQLLF